MPESLRSSAVSPRNFSASTKVTYVYTSWVITHSHADFRHFRSIAFAGLFLDAGCFIVLAIFRFLDFSKTGYYL